MDYSSFLKAAARVKPSARQAEFLKNPFYAFVHFSPNTYTGREWGLGNEDPAIFNPTELDCDQWVKAIKSAGMTGMILTAKHHDGFCLWQSRYTEHCMKNSPYKNGRGDVVREAAEARGTTRAVVSMEEAVKATPNALFAVGNAPTALIRLCELIEEGKCAPALVIGVPVGFVNVVESKERLLAAKVPYITAVGRKGGSPVASTIVNALLYGIE